MEGQRQAGSPERREGLRACYWEGPSELPERRTLCEQPTAGWDLGSFQFGAVMDSAAMNTLDVSLCEHRGSFLWIYIFRQGISDESIWHYEIFANLHSHQQFRRF